MDLASISMALRWIDVMRGSLVMIATGVVVNPWPFATPKEHSSVCSANLRCLFRLLQVSVVLVSGWCNIPVGIFSRLGCRVIRLLLVGFRYSKSPGSLVCFFLLLGWCSEVTKASLAETFSTRLVSSLLTRKALLEGLDGRRSHRGIDFPAGHRNRGICERTGKIRE